MATTTRRSKPPGKASSSLTKADRSRIARQAAAKAIATKRANGTLSSAATKATETKRQNGTLAEAARKAAATRKANAKAVKRTRPKAKVAAGTS